MPHFTANNMASVWAHRNPAGVPLARFVGCPYPVERSQRQVRRSELPVVALGCGRGFNEQSAIHLASELTATVDEAER
jgi:hypothetical protein